MKLKKKGLTLRDNLKNDSGMLLEISMMQKKHDIKISFQSEFIPILVNFFFSFSAAASCLGAIIE